MRDHAFTVTGGSVTGARRLVSGKNLRWEIVVSPDSNGDVTITLPATTDCDAQGAICADGDRMLSNRLERTVSGPGPVMDNEKSRHRWTGEAGGSVRDLDLPRYEPYRNGVPALP